MLELLLFLCEKNKRLENRVKLYNIFYIFEKYMFKIVNVCEIRKFYSQNDVYSRGN